MFDTNALRANIENQSAIVDIPRTVSGRCDAAALIRALRSDGAESTASLLMQWVILSACRVSEAQFIRHEDIDLIRKIWTLPAESTKSGQTRMVPITGRMARLLCAAAKRNPASDYVFAKSGSFLGLSECMVLQETRSKFASWAVHTQKFRGQLILEHLGHSPNRTASLRSQKKMMNAWAAYLALHGVKE